MNIVGFIGCGRIGSAMLKRLAIKNDCFELLAHDRTRSKIDHVNRYVERLTEKISEGENPTQAVTFVDNLPELVERSNYIVIAVQHDDLPELLQELAQHLTEGKVLLSTMSSVPSKVIRAKTRYTAPVVRLMLNIPVAYGKGVIAISQPKETLAMEIKNRATFFLTEEQEEFIAKLVKPLGQKIYLAEDKMSIFTAVIAGGPAYTFFFMEAMLQAALTAGIPYLEAKKCVANCVEGSAYMGSRDSQSFGDLRLQATPPGGISIRATNQMELKAIRGEIVNAILLANDYCMSREEKYEEK